MFNIKERIHLLQGPERIQVTDEHLIQLKATYGDFSNEMEEMIHDFFVPLNLMRDVGAYTGTSADKFIEFCDIIHYYLELQVRMATEMLNHTSTTFENNIHAAETIIE